MSRVLALVGAILLVVAAVFARQALDDDGGDGDGDDDGDVLVVRCIPELEVACEALEREADVTIEDPEATIAAVLSEDADIDAWVTLDPWPAIAQFSEEDETFDGQVGVASGPLSVVYREATVPGACEETPTFACIQGVEPDRAVLRPTFSALGLLASGAAAADVFLDETGSASFARQDLEDSVAGARISQFVFDQDPVDEMLVVGTAGPIATIDAERGAQLEIDGTRDDGNLLFFELPTPASVAVVVSGPGADRITGEPAFTAALEDLGWRVTPNATTTGLPPAGVLVALAEFIG